MDLKSIKSFSGTVLCICLLLGLTEGAYAVPEKPAYECGSISYTDSVGRELFEIPGRGTVTAKITVKGKSDLAEELMFALFLYSDDKLSGAAVDRKQVNDSTEFSASVEIPNGASKCELTAVLWDGMYGMKPICASGLFPGGSNLLRGLKINGADVEGFNPDVHEYTYPISGLSKEKPIVSAESMNGSAKIGYYAQGKFPGKTVVRVLPADGGEPSYYTINYVADRSLAGDAKVISPSGSIYGSFEIGKNFHESDGGDVKDPNRSAENGALGSKVYWDREQPAIVANGYTNEVRTISPQYKFLQGCDYIMCTASMANRSDNGYYRTFKIYRSADIYVLATNSFGSCEGWECTRDTANPPVSVQRDTDDYLTYCAKKHFEVTNSDVGLEVGVPKELTYNISSSGQAFSSVSLVVIDYDGYDSLPDNESTEDLEPPVRPDPKTGADGVQVVKTENGVTENLSGAPTDVSHELAQYTAESGSGSLIGFDRGSSANYPDYNNIFDVSEDSMFILGSDYIKTALQNSGKWLNRASNGWETSFMLYEPATVYCFGRTGNSTAAAEYGWEFEEKTDGEPAYMRFRAKSNNDSDAVVSFVHRISKHFNGDKYYGEHVVINKELLYPVNGAGDSAGEWLFVIVYDSQH